MDTKYIGIDRERAKNDIMTYDYNATGALSSCSNTYEELLWALKGNWSSPIAKEFTDKKVPEFETIVNNYWDELAEIIQGAYEAANILLTSNGESTIDVERNIDDFMFKIFPLALPKCEISNNGITGMNVDEVKAAVSKAKTSMDSAIARIDELPEGISFFDPQGTLIDTYNKGIKKFKVNFQELFDNTIKEINEYITNESANIIAAKEKATEAMKS